MASLIAFQQIRAQTQQKVGAPPPPMYGSSSAETEAAAASEVASLKRKRGYRSTIATSEEGLTGAAPVTKKKLGE